MFVIVIIIIIIIISSSSIHAIITDSDRCRGDRHGGDGGRWREPETEGAEKIGKE